MPRFEHSPKLSAEEEVALLKTLRLQREQKARVLLQAEAQNVARLKLADVAIEKVPEDAAVLVGKDKKNFAIGSERMAVIAITINAVLLTASSKVEEAPAKKGGAGGKKAKATAKPKIGAKVERLPPPTGDAAAEAIIKHKRTIERVCKIKDKKGEPLEKESQDAQQALLAAVEAWLCCDHNEPVLPEAPKLLQALSSEGLLDGELLSEYWTNVLSTRASDSVELLAAEARCKEAEADTGTTTEQLKQGKKEDAEAAQQAKWAAAEVQNARTGNQPSVEEVAREKAASVADTKARAWRLQTQKKVELFHKEQVAALNAHEAANKELAEKGSAMRTCGLMHQYGQLFFEPGAAAAEGADAPVCDKAAAAEGAAVFDPEPRV